MSTDPCALETLPESSPLPSPTRKTVILTEQEFVSLCHRARLMNSIASRFFDMLMTIRSRTKKRTISQKRLARKLRRQAMAETE